MHEPWLAWKTLIVVALLSGLAVGLFSSKLTKGAVFDTSIEQVSVLLTDEQYDAAKDLLLGLDERYEPSAEVYYLLAYIADMTNPRDIHMETLVTTEMNEHDIEYVKLLQRVIDTDPLFEPEKFSQINEHYLFMDAYFKITSHVGMFASSNYFLRDYQKALEYYQLSKQYGGFDNCLLEYSANILNSCEPNAIVFTNGDMDTFPGWYLQMIPVQETKEYIPQTSDIFISQKDKANLSKALSEKNKNLHGMRTDITIANLSLLNTSWYIMHLRDDEGVIVNWSDEQFNSLADKEGSYFDLLWQDEVTFSAGDPSGKRKFTIDYLTNYDNSDEDGGFYPQTISDYAVIQIVKDNFGKRPIYFSITCDSYVGFDDYLRNEGMVCRLVHTAGTEGEQIDIDRLLNNIDNIYSYTYYTSDTLHRTANIKSLVRNYGAIYTRAAIYFTKKNDLDKAYAYAQKARSFVESDLRMSEFFIRYYAGTGSWDKVDKFIEDSIFPDEDAAKYYIGYVLNVIAEDYPHKFVYYMQKFLLEYRDNIKYSAWAYYFANKYDLQDEVEAMFDSLQGKLGYTRQDMQDYLYNGD